MNRDQIINFMAVYETGSFALAGKTVHLSSQGVGRSVRALEGDIGRPLFAEHTLKPTRYADALYAFATAAEAEYRQLLDEFDRIREEERNVIRVCFSLGLADAIGTDMFDEFARAEPGVEFFFEEHVDSQCDKGVEGGAYDFGFTVAPVSSNLEGVELFRQQMSMRVNVANPLSRKDRITIDDLQGQVVATPFLGAKNVDALVDRCKLRDVKPKKIVHLSQMFRIYDLVLANKGIGTHIEGVIESPLFSDDRVVCVPLEDFVYSISFSWARGRELSEVERRLVDFVSRTPLFRQSRSA